MGSGGSNGEGLRVRKRTGSWMLAWAVVATLLLVVSVGWPDAGREVAGSVARALRPAPAEAQTTGAAPQLEWLGWQFFRVTALRGHVTAFDPKPGQVYFVTVRGTRPR